jgi:DNA invertase Pin-like site-specific DNA recombinase
VRELEKLKIKERSAEGIAVARAEGKYRGRKIGSLQSDSLDYYKDIQKSLKS